MDREKVINDLQDAVNDDWMWQHADYYAKAMENAIALLKEHDNCENCAIAIEDRQPVIRCKDCKYAYLTDDGECKYCEMENDDNGFLIERYRSWDWFCADGERKEGR